MKKKRKRKKNNNNFSILSDDENNGGEGPTHLRFYFEVVFFFFFLLISSIRDWDCELFSSNCFYLIRRSNGTFAFVFFVSLEIFFLFANLQARGALERSRSRKKKKKKNEWLCKIIIGFILITEKQYQYCFSSLLSFCCHWLILIHSKYLWWISAPKNFKSFTIAR